MEIQPAKLSKGSYKFETAQQFFGWLHQEHTGKFKNNTRYEIRSRYLGPNNDVVCLSKTSNSYYGTDYNLPEEIGNLLVSVWPKVGRYERHGMLGLAGIIKLCKRLWPDEYDTAITMYEAGKAQEQLDFYEKQYANALQETVGAAAKAREYASKLGYDLDEVGKALAQLAEQTVHNNDKKG